MITTRPRPSGNLFHFVQDLLRMMPNAFFYPRSERAHRSGLAASRPLLDSRKRRVRDGIIFLIESCLRLLMAIEYATRLCFDTKQP